MISTILNIQIPGNTLPFSLPRSNMNVAPTRQSFGQPDQYLPSFQNRGAEPLGEDFSSLLQGLEENFGGRNPLMELLELTARMLVLLCGGSASPSLSTSSPPQMPTGPHSASSPLSQIAGDFLGGEKDATSKAASSLKTGLKNSSRPALSALSGLAPKSSGQGTPLLDATSPSPPSEKPAGTNLRSQNAAQPVDAPITSSQANRSAKNYDSVIDQFDVANNPRYAQRDSNGDGVTDTFCNIFVSDVTRAMGAEIPHWWQGRELNANATCDWLQNEGAKFGWKKVSEQQAQDLANQGKPVVVTLKNGGGIGHVGMVRPGENSNGPALAQSGATNVNKAHVRDNNTFGNSDAIYYAHS